MKKPKFFKQTQNSHDFQIRRVGDGFWHFLSFALLLTIYLFDTQVILRLVHFIPKNISGFVQQRWSHFYLRSVALLDRKTNSISRLDLIELSIRNMQIKRVRSVVTVGGMAIGIGAIVFLVSIGFGLEQLVVSRVARLDEMKQADVSMQTGSKIKIDDKTLASFKDISQIELSLPLIAVVGRVNYQNSVSDMAVYGVTTQYLQQSAIKPVQGKIFDSNELAMEVPRMTGEVAGATTQTAKTGQKIQDIEFSINPSEWIRVRESPDPKANIIGYTKRSEGVSAGEEIWGGSYQSDDSIGKAGTDENGKKLGKWIKAQVYLWKNQTCNPKLEGDCENGKFMVLRDKDGKQVQKTGYFAEINITLVGTSISEAKVLGVATTSATVASGSSSINWVEIASEAGIIKPPETKTVELGASAKKQAVVNRAMLKVLGIPETLAVGKTFTVSFVVVGDLLADNKQQVESAPSEYTIIGVTPDERTPLFYVPFVDLRSLGITNYSQVKVVVKDNGANLSRVRRQIEAMGYITRSVADTVAQINSLFSTARTILALLGIVALAVAALGMFNTLTVSLLERTREVGLMKAMGMKSSEISELFLTESMIMGFFGGILGIILGFLAGKALGIILSLFALFKGVGFVDVSYIPFTFVLVVIALSLLVGVLTGIYPAKRATKISALNALRYE